MKTRKLEMVPVQHLIRNIRGQRVMLDADLAGVYGVKTARLNQQVRRNADRFPEDFAFRLASAKFASLMLQSATSKKGRGGRRKLPLAFTEHGAIMAANMLNSPRAVQMSVFVVRAFVKMREALAQTRELAAKLAELDRTLTARVNNHEQAIIAILDEIKKLMEPVPEPEPRRREIGFHVREEAQAAKKPGAVGRRFPGCRKRRMLRRAAHPTTIDGARGST